MKVKASILVIIFMGVLACKPSNHASNEEKAEAIAEDSLSGELSSRDVLFSIPTPGQTAWLLNNYEMYFSLTVLPKLDNIQKYNTNFSRALVLGSRGADLSYLIIFDKRDLVQGYLDQINNLMIAVETGSVNTQDLMHRFDQNIGRRDSLIAIVSDIYRNCDQYLKQNDRDETSVLILTGGWLESFCLLTRMYSNYPQEELFNVILYQSEVLDLLIKLLKPYYSKTKQHTALVDGLVRVAYEFDVMEKKRTKTVVLTDTVNHISFIKNNLSQTFTGSRPDSLSIIANDLRSKFLN